MFNQKYPYTDFHELNLDWLLGQMLELKADVRDFVKLNTIKYANPIAWNITTQYEANTVVVDSDGNAYLSVQPVPAGVAINNTDYWTEIGSFGSIFGDIKASIAEADEGSSTVASANRAVGELVWLSDTLYQITVAINTGESYVPGTNCEEITIEELLQNLRDNYNDVNNEVITIKSSILSIGGQIEDINNRLEVHYVYNVKDFGAKGDNITDDTEAVMTAVDAVNDTGGCLYFPVGKYIITDPIVINHYGVTIRGENQQAVYLMIKHNDDAIWMGTEEDDQLKVSMFVEHLSVIYQHTATSTHRGIYMRNCANSGIDDVIVSEFKTGILWKHVGNSFITRTGVTSTLANAVGFDIGDMSVSSSMRDCYAGFLGDAGGAVDNGIGLVMNRGDIADFTIDYFDVGNGGYAMIIDGNNSPADLPPADLRFTNIVADGARSGGIKISNLNDQANIVINGGWLNIYRTNIQCIEVANSNNVSICNFVFQQLLKSTPTQTGIYAHGVSHIQILGCKFINMARALDLQTVDGAIIADNLINLYTGYSLTSGFHIYGHALYHAIFKNNIMKSTTVYDIYIDSGDTIQITGNDVATAITVDASVTTKINKDNIIAGSVQT